MPARKQKKSKVQAVAFNTSYWTANQARYWLDTHGFVRKKRVDKTANGKWLRYRMYNPKQFKKYATKKTPKGINFVIGFT